VAVVIALCGANYQCDSFDQWSLYKDVMSVVTPAERALMASGRFNRVSEGLAVTIVNSTTGEAMGGGTNTLGYGVCVCL
jgi:hypothetical protein